MSTQPEETIIETAAAPSAEFINAISRFFDTDPSDLLVELGYYQRGMEPVTTPVRADVAAQQE